LVFLPTTITPANRHRTREPGGMRRGPFVFLLHARRNKTFHGELVPDVAITRTGGHCMRRIALIGLALLAMTVSASARLGMVPSSEPDSAVIQVRGGHGRGHGHMGRGGRGHHYGWGRGRGHHYGWYRGRGHHRHRW